MVDFTGLDRAGVDDRSVIFRFTCGDIIFDSPQEYEKMLAALSAKISDTSKRSGGKTIAKAVDAITFHVEKIQLALSTIGEMYGEMITPHESKKRTSSAFKTRKGMLDAMSDKVLKLFSEAYVDDADEYIFPDDRAVFITHVLDAMAAADEKKVAMAASGK